MSRYSPGIVEDGELLTRFVFSPIHVDKRGKVKPTLFSYAADKGCSILRERLATADEISTFATDFLKKDSRFTWLGVTVGHCQNVREIRVDGRPDRTVCVYDTAERANRAHAEICFTSFVLDDGDTNEMRHHLMMAFNAETTLISPETYQGGRIWARLPTDLRRKGH